MTNTAKLQVAFSLAVITAFFFPYMKFGQDMWLTVHDSLDSNVSWYTALVNSGHLFSFSNDVHIDRIMNGTLPRNALPGAFSIVSILFALLEPYDAFISIKLLSHVIAFAGMYLLLKRHLLVNEESGWAALMVATCFTFLPFYHMYGCASISGLPFILFAFLNLWKGKDLKASYLILLLAPLFGSLVLVGFSVIAVAGSAWILQLIRTRTWNISFLLGLVFFTVTSILATLNLFILQFANSGFTSHRSTFTPPSLAFDQAILDSAAHFIKGQYHAPSIHFSILCFALVVLILSIYKTRSRLKGPAKWMAILLGAAILISNLKGFWNYGPITALRSAIPLLKAFQFDRFYMLFPLLWYMVLGLSLATIFQLLDKRWAFAIGTVFCTFQLIQIINGNDEYRYGLERAFGKEVEAGPSYSTFYDVELFNRIRADIGIPENEYRVASLGIFPNIALYNGFYVLDSYQQNYDLNYQYEFRKVMERELDKAPEIAEYYDGWGGRCYLYSSELGKAKRPNKWEDRSIRSFDLNTEQFRKMGGRFIFSTVEIENASSIELEMKGIYKGEWWRIFLYGLQPATPLLGSKK